MDPLSPARTAESHANSNLHDARQTTTPSTRRYTRIGNRPPNSAYTQTSPITNQHTLADLSGQLFAGLRDHPAAAKIALEILARLSKDETRNTCPTCRRPFEERTEQTHEQE